ncbi:MAG: hypothetical protein AAFQ73_07980, partial [Pseudomonadota bacterium]
MTVWEGSGQYTDETRYRVISATEFSRRLRHAITRQEMSVTWFLGAGCSKSSGIPCADELARTWIADLKYVETGEEHDVDAWAARLLDVQSAFRADLPAGLELNLLFDQAAYTEERL